MAQNLEFRGGFESGARLTFSGTRQFFLQMLVTFSLCLQSLGLSGTIQELGAAPPYRGLESIAPNGKHRSG